METIDRSTKPNPFEVCGYDPVTRKLCLLVRVDTMDQAELAAMDMHRDKALVTVYGRNGNARKGWYLRAPTCVR